MLSSYLPPTRSSSEPKVSLLDISNLGRMWSTNGNLDPKSKPPRRGVKFGNSTHILLIPSRDEYRQAGLGDKMWWNSADYDLFKSEAVSELRNLMMIDDRIDAKMAQNILYQPPSKLQTEIKKKLKVPSSQHMLLEKLSQPYQGFSTDIDGGETDRSLSDSSSDDMESSSQHLSILPISPTRNISAINITRVKSEVDLVMTQHDVLMNNSNIENDNKITRSKSSNDHSLFSNSISKSRPIHPLAYLCQ